MALQIFCENGDGISTAIGCINISSPNSFIGWLLPKLIGVIGGIAFVLMISGSIQIITSSGDPQKLKGGQQTISSAVAGLLFTIFSLFILRLIGIDILHIPGLN